MAGEGALFFFGAALEVRCAALDPTWSKTLELAVSTADIIGIVGVVLAVVSIGVAWYYARRAELFTKRELRWTAEPIPILGDAFHSVAKVVVDGRELETPYILRIRVKNTGRRDIESSMFDQARPLVFSLGGVTYAHPVEGDALARLTDQHKLEVGPDLLPAGKSWDYSFVCAGAPTVTLNSHLANVKIKELPDILETGSWTDLKHLFLPLLIFVMAGISGALVAFIALANR